jgi:hypothetical protein
MKKMHCCEQGPPSQFDQLIFIIKPVVLYLDFSKPARHALSSGNAQQDPFPVAQLLDLQD